MPIVCFKYNTILKGSVSLSAGRVNKNRNEYEGSKHAKDVLLFKKYMYVNIIIFDR
jgi:hypothetical protein